METRVYLPRRKGDRDRDREVGWVPSLSAVGTPRTRLGTGVGCWTGERQLGCRLRESSVPRSFTVSSGVGSR